MTKKTLHLILLEMPIPHYYSIKRLKSILIISFPITKINWKTHLTFITLNYHILATFHTISKINSSRLWKEFCKETLDINLVFNSLKTKNCFSYKSPIPNDFKSFLIYKYTSVSCSFSYIGLTYCRLKTRIEEHVKKG